MHEMMYFLTLEIYLRCSVLVIIVIMGSNFFFIVKITSYWTRISDKNLKILWICCIFEWNVLRFFENGFKKYCWSFLELYQTFQNLGTNYFCFGSWLKFTYWKLYETLLFEEKKIFCENGYWNLYHSHYRSIIKIG